MLYKTFFNVSSDGLSDKNLFKNVHPQNVNHLKSSKQFRSLILDVNLNNSHLQYVKVCL